MFAVLYKVYEGRVFIGILLSNGIRVKFIPKELFSSIGEIEFLNVFIREGEVITKPWCILPSIQRYEVDRFYGENVMRGEVVLRRIA